jgi:DNA-binding beta-propeller fold protein YncE
MRVLFPHLAGWALSLAAPLVSATPVAPAALPVAGLTATALPLPGGPGLVRMDYLAYDPATQRLWVPGGNTGTVAVIETATGKLTPIAGFATAEQESPRGKRTVGPSSVTVGAGMVYIGNRADSTVCAVDPKSLKRGGCVSLASMPDGLAYIAATREVWVTTPRDKSLTFLDVARREAPVVKGKLVLEGQPEGYAVDPGRGLFYTNLEDKDQTLAVDVKTRKVVASWKPGCSPGEPQGLALDGKRRLLFVACSDHLVALDVAAADPKPKTFRKTASC